MIITRDKMKSDICILQDLLLKEDYEIIIIENQLETKELNADGSNEYFEWRKRAISAINFRRAKKNSVKRQLNHWEFLLQSIKTESEIQLKREGIAHSKEMLEKGRELKKEKEIARILRHDKLVQATLKKEQEKTKRHQESENEDLLILKEFKILVKEFLGMDKYVELIQLAHKNIIKH